MPVPPYTRRDLLKLAAAGAMTPWLRPQAAAAENERDLLAARAASFHRQVLDVAMGPGGLIIAFLPFAPRRPFQEGEVLDPWMVRNLHKTWGTFTPRPTPADWYYGENTLWATGWMLYAQMLRYRATGEAEALATARKCFRDLNHVFALSRTIEPGLLGKPHGGRPGPTTSYDQAACPVIFYAQFARELATPAEKAEAVSNMAAHGEYYLRHRWVMNHHGKLQDVAKLAPTSLMKYLACEYAAYEMSGETRYRDEAIRQMRGLIRAGKLPWATPTVEFSHNPFYYSVLCDYWRTTEIAGECDWVGCIREYWRSAKASLGPDGMPRPGVWDTRRGSFTPAPYRWSPATQEFSSPTFVGGFISPVVAALALIARSHGLDDDAHLIARKILLRLDDDAMRWWWSTDGRFPEEMRQARDTFAPEVPAAWQIAYWLGRQQRVW